MDKKTSKLVKMLLRWGLCIGEAYSIKYLYESGIKPWHKWNMIVMLAIGLFGSIEKGIEDINEVNKILDEVPSEEETSETEETAETE